MGAKDPDRQRAKRGTVQGAVTALRLPVELRERIDAARGKVSLGLWLREAAEQRLERERTR